MLTLLRLKARKYIAAIVAAVASLAADPIRQLVFPEADVRWYSESDSKSESHTIIVRNAGASVSPPVRIELDVPAKAVADLDVGAFAQLPRTSFLRTLASLPSLERIAPSKEGPLSALLDEHSQMSALYGLDEALHDTFVSEMLRRGQGRQPFDSFPGAHPDWLKKCGTNSSANPGCLAEKAWEGHERILRGVQKEAAELWQKATGVAVNFSGSSFDPQGTLQFTLAPRAGESCYLTVHRGPNPADLPLRVSDAEKLTKVETAAALTVNRWWFAFRYRFRQVAPWLLIVLVFLLASILWKIAEEPVQVFEVVNRALRTRASDASGLWQLVRKRTGYFMLNEFRGSCLAFQKLNVNLTPEQLFTSLRNFLRMEYGLTSAEYSQQPELESAIRMWMRELAAHA